jgi:serine/threonine-protein kinase
MERIMIGMTLNDRYLIDNELGRGGMGTVYRAHDQTLNRDVAVKLMSDTHLSADGGTRLIREAQAIARLSHPNIVVVYDVGKFEGVPYIVMELVEGSPLNDYEPEGFEEIVSITCQLCAALEHAHNHHVVHRDLKPENVMISVDGVAKLMDFGVARSVASRFTMEGDIVGTVFYLAPETALGKQVDDRADLYSLGVMLYELTTGELPFVDPNPISVITQHLHAPVIPPRAKDDSIPPHLDSLIVRLLSKDPDDRPATAKEAQKLLERPEMLDLGAVPEGEISVLDRIVRGRMVGRRGEFEEAGGTDPVHQR